jgi:hypothetical protein
MMRPRLIAFALSLTLPGARSAAQDATLAGRVVHKVSKDGVPGAEVRLSPRNTQALTDSAGYFHFDHVAPGAVWLLVRRLGFAPESVAVEVRPANDLHLLVELKETAQPLDPVTVKESERPFERGKLAGFDSRKTRGIGRFFDADIFEKERDRQLGEIILSRVPGVRLVRSHYGTATYLATGRRSAATVSGSKSTLAPEDRDSGADPRACYPDVYLDGVPVYLFGNSPPSPLFDMNSIGLSTVAAVELYAGPAQTPLQYNKTGALCGVVLIWTK